MHWKCACTHWGCIRTGADCTAWSAAGWVAAKPPWMHCWQPAPLLAAPGGGAGTPPIRFCYLQLLTPGLPEVLHTLHSAGLVLAVVSNSSVEVVDGALQQCGIRPYFQQIFSGWQIPQCKPDPYLYRQAMQAFGLSPETCLVVEDSPVGICAGRGAGLPVAALRDRDGLIDQNEADVVLPTIQSLLQLPCVQQCICN